MKLVIVSGLSGSGKSIVLHSLEDLNFYCIDNLPLSLLPSFAKQMASSPRSDYEHAAVGIDARNLNDDFASFPDVLAEIRGCGLDCEILFLQAEDNTLIKRFSETRRKHPLTRSGISLAEAIGRERTLLAELAVNADWCIDSSHTNVHQLRDLVRGRMLKEAGSLTLTFISFGFKHGVPVDADFVFDVRCLPNPHWVPELRAFTGMDQAVAEFLEQQPLVSEMFEDLSTFIERWVPRFQADSRAYMTVAIGCTGGQHRSVYLSQRMASHFHQADIDVLLRHRELT